MSQEQRLFQLMESRRKKHRKTRANRPPTSPPTTTPLPRIPEMQTLPGPSAGNAGAVAGDDVSAYAMPPLCRRYDCTKAIAPQGRGVCAGCDKAFCLGHVGRCMGCLATICGECMRVQVCRNVFRSLEMRGPAVAKRTWRAIEIRARQCDQCQPPCPDCTSLSVADGGIGCLRCGRTMCTQCLSAAASWIETACDSCYEKVLHRDRECAISLLLL